LVYIFPLWYFTARRIWQRCFLFIRHFFRWKGFNEEISFYRDSFLSNFFVSNFFCRKTVKWKQDSNLILLLRHWVSRNGS
jgi:hypothetical protein